MTTRDIYGLAVRRGGLVCCIFALFAPIHVLALAVSVPLPSTYPVKIDALIELGWLITGLILTFAADPNAALVYRQKRLNGAEWNLSPLPIRRLHGTRSRTIAYKARIPSTTQNCRWRTPRGIRISCQTDLGQLRDFER